MTFITATVMHGGAWLVGAAVVVGVLLAARAGTGRWIDRPSRLQFAILLVSIAGGLRLAAVLAIPYRPAADFAIYHNTGVATAQRWTLEGSPPEPDYYCLYPPGQIFTLGAVYALFGPHVPAGQVLNVVISAAMVLGVWFLASRVFGERVGRITSRHYSVGTGSTDRRASGRRSRWGCAWASAR